MATIHLSKIYGAQMPCSHQYSLGVEKPPHRQALNLSVQEIWPKCVLEMRKLAREAPDQSPAHIAYANPGKAD
jgi:hypothetical protein